MERGQVRGTTVNATPPSNSNSVRMQSEPIQPDIPMIGPDSDELNSLAALFNSARILEVEEVARKLMLRFPQHGAAYMALGTVLAMQGRIAEAVSPMQRAAMLMPNNADAHCNLGNMWQDQQRYADAETCYRLALAIRPTFAEAHSYLGLNLMSQGRLDLAEASCRRALEIAPDSINAHGNLGILLHHLGRLHEAEVSFRKRLQLDSQCVETLTSLSAVLKLQGRFVEAHACLKRAVDINPTDTGSRSAYLFNLGYDASVSLHARMDEARRYGQIVDAKATGRFSSWLCPASPKRLRVGLVSGDLREHPVGYFLDGILSHFDHDRLELIAYPTTLKKDKLGTRMQQHFSKWTPLAGFTDDDAARQIHADGVHVLIDLAGHTAHNRLPVFAWKPAPIQVTWLGDLATTGVAQIDYLLVDLIGVPTGAQTQFTETLWYLPDTRLCFTPPENAPEVAPSPTLVNGYVTFGCFQNMAKIGDDVLAVWSSILAALPTARLRIQCLELGFPATRERLTQRMHSKNMDLSRVTFHGSVKREAYLAAHAEVDMILDTFPYPGTTTTCEALWMGVPTLTVAGDSLLSRGGASVMTAIGLTDWIASSSGEYERKAIAFATDIASLAGLRGVLRQRAATSPVFDAPRFARHLQDALWEMWRRYANTQRA